MGSDPLRPPGYVLEDPEDVAGDIFGIFLRQFERREVIELACGTCEEWVWVVFRCADWFSGSGDTRFGLWIDVEAAADPLGMTPGESMGEMVWYSMIDEPQYRPEQMSASRERYWFQDGIYWRSVPDETDRES